MSYHFDSGDGDGEEAFEQKEDPNSSIGDEGQVRSPWEEVRVGKRQPIVLLSMLGKSKVGHIVPKRPWGFPGWTSFSLTYSLLRIMFP